MVFIELIGNTVWKKTKVNVFQLSSVVMMHFLYYNYAIKSPKKTRASIILYVGIRQYTSSPCWCFSCGECGRLVSKRKPADTQLHHPA